MNYLKQLFQNSASEIETKKTIVLIMTLCTKCNKTLFWLTTVNKQKNSLFWQKAIKSLTLLLFYHSILCSVLGWSWKGNKFGCKNMFVHEFALFLVIFWPKFFQTSQFAFETRHILLKMGCNCLHLRYNTQVERERKIYNT